VAVQGERAPIDGRQARARLGPLAGGPSDCYMQAMPQQCPGEDEAPPQPGRRGKWRPWIRLLLTAVVLSLVAWYIAAHLREFGVIRRLSLPVLAGALGLSVLVHACSAAAAYLVVRAFGASLRAWEAAMLEVLTRFWNLLTPFRGGAFVRAVHLKKVHQLPYVHFMAGLSGMLVTAVFVNMLCAWGGCCASAP
jgi:uncharacterized membrane protein YbhN (UPF0104 family)